MQSTRYLATNVDSHWVWELECVEECIGDNSSSGILFIIFVSWSVMSHLVSAPAIFMNLLIILGLRTHPCSSLRSMGRELSVKAEQDLTLMSNSPETWVTMITMIPMITMITMKHFISHSKSWVQWSEDVILVQVESCLDNLEKIMETDKVGKLKQKVFISSCPRMWLVDNHSIDNIINHQPASHHHTEEAVGTKSDDWRLCLWERLCFLVGEVWQWDAGDEEDD